MTSKSYKYRLYPTEEQEVFFKKNFGCVRLVYNLLLNAYNENYEARKKDPSIPRANPRYVDFKEDYPFLSEADSRGLSQAKRDLKRAFSNFFRNPKHFGYPQFKSKWRSTQSYSAKTAGVKFPGYGVVKLPKLADPVKIVMERPLPGRVLSTKISMEPTGKYFISFTCEAEVEELPKTDKSVGIDLGLTDFIATSNGDKVPSPKFSKEFEKRLAREQRKLSRRAEGAKKRGVPLSEAKNYQKQKKKVARLHEKVRNQRTDFLQKLSTELIRNHDIICVEDLNVKGLMKNRRLSRSIGDVSWSKFVEMLEYKAGWYGRKLIKVDRWYASTRICSSCNANGGKKELSVREWTCTNCGVHHDRDINAAKNILNEGLPSLL